LIKIPLSDMKLLKRYNRDTKLKKFLKGYQTINPYGLKQHIWEQLVLHVD
jgi:hypothetical protein